MKKFFSDKKNLWLVVLSVIVFVLFIVIAIPKRSDIVAKGRTIEYNAPEHTAFSSQITFLYFFDEPIYYDTLEIKAFNEKKECSVSFCKLDSNNPTDSFFYGDRIQIIVKAVDCTSLNLSLKIYGVNGEYKKLVKSQKFSLS